MQTARQRGTKTVVAIGASAVLHVGLLVGLLLYRPALFIPVEPAGPPEAIIPILLMPRVKPAAAAGAPQGDLKLHRRAQRFAALPPEVTPLVTATPARSAPAGASGTAPTTAPSAATAAGPDLRAALRYGAGGCGNRATLSRSERDLCDERLGRTAASADFIPAPIEPAKRAYYDAVTLAKKPDGQPVPQRAIGRLGLFDADPRGQTGRAPGIGCHIALGPGKKKPLPSHWLTLGPCFIAPPQGPLSVEADITPP